MNRALTITICSGILLIFIVISLFMLRQNTNSNLLLGFSFIVGFAMIFGPLIARSQNKL